jgi:hypothetical protein
VADEGPSFSSQKAGSPYVTDAFRSTR